MGLCCCPQKTTETNIASIVIAWADQRWMALVWKGLNASLCVVSSSLIVLWKTLSTSLMQGLLSFCCPCFLLLRGTCTDSCQEKLFCRAFCNASSRVSVLYFPPLGFDLSSLHGWWMKTSQGRGAVVMVGRGWHPDSKRNWRRCADVCLQFSSPFSFRLSLEERAESAAVKENVENWARRIHFHPNFWWLDFFYTFLDDGFQWPRSMCSHFLFGQGHRNSSAHRGSTATEVNIFFASDWKELPVQSLEKRYFLLACRFQSFPCQLDKLGQGFATKCQHSVWTKKKWDCCAWLLFDCHNLLFTRTSVALIRFVICTSPCHSLKGDVDLWLNILSMWALHELSIKTLPIDVCLRFLVILVLN